MALTEQKQEELRDLAARLGKEHHCFSDPTQIKKMEGLGDLVAKVTSTIGIKPCTGCKKRQSLLNKFIPFR